MDVSMIEHEVNSINKQITDATLKAERQSSNKEYGDPWSPKMAEAGWETSHLLEESSTESVCGL